MVIVLVSIFSAQIDEHFIGSAYVRRDEIEATARATLSALNRWLEPYLTNLPATEHLQLT